MEMNLRNSENVGSFSREHKGTGPISGLRDLISHLGYLLTEAPDRYKQFPTTQEFAQMSTNKGCGSSGGNDDQYTEEQAKKDAHREGLRRDQQARRELEQGARRPR